MTNKTDERREVVRPDEPTPEMVLAGARALRDSFGWDNQSARAIAVYHAMLKAREAK